MYDTQRLDYVLCCVAQPLRTVTGIYRRCFYSNFVRLFELRTRLDDGVILFCPLPVARHAVAGCHSGEWTPMYGEKLMYGD